MNKLRRLFDHLDAMGDETVAAKRRRLLEDFPIKSEDVPPSPLDSPAENLEQSDQLTMLNISRLLTSVEDDVVVNELNEQVGVVACLRSFHFNLCCIF